MEKRAKKEKYPSKYFPVNPQKYVGDVNKITLRSSWEKRFVLFLDYNPAVKQWNSEDIAIQYFFEPDGKWHRYFPDFFMISENSQGELIKFLIEIKPLKDMEVKAPKRMTEKAKANMIKQVLTYEKNKAKWLAAEAWCKERDIIFKVVTETELFS
jgi:hypothetical protein